MNQTDGGKMVVAFQFDIFQPQNHKHVFLWGQILTAQMSVNVAVFVFALVFAHMM